MGARVHSPVSVREAENIITIPTHPKFLDDGQVKIHLPRGSWTDHAFESAKFEMIIRSLIHSRDYPKLMLI
jgi:hypothetical protein